MQEETMWSTYLSGSNPRWTPTTEHDLDNAAADGLLEETHYLDLKGKVELGSRAKNQEFARDLAQFAIDGGTVIIGVAESASGPPTLTAQPLTGLAERIEQIARSVPDPPLPILCHPIPSSADRSMGYLIVSVPPSSQAPHMVDNKYLGRGDKTKHYLSDPEVRRLHERQHSRHRDIDEQLSAYVARDPLAATQRLAHLFLIAEPLAPTRPDMLLDLTSGQGHERRMFAVVQPARDLSIATLLPHQHFQPGIDLDEANRNKRQDHGAAIVSAYIDEAGSHIEDLERVEERLIAVDIDEGGPIRLYCSRLSMRHRDGAHHMLNDAVAVTLTRRLLVIVATVTDHAGYLGEWGLGLAATGLRGLASSAHWGRLVSSGQTFTNDEYQRVTTASYVELTQSPGAVASRLAGPFVRALATDDLCTAAFTDPPPVVT